MKTSENTDQIIPALLEAQKQMKDAKKDADNPMFRSNYATLESVLEAAKKPLNANGIWYTQSPEGDGECVQIVTRLFHTSGQWVESTLSMKPVPSKVDRASGAVAVTPQAVGSTITYGRRYALSAILGLGADDDDGNAASAAEKGAQAPQEDLGTFEDGIKDVRMSVKTSKQGDFTVFTIITEGGHHLGTLDKEVATAAKSFKGTGEQVIIESEPGKYGPRITAIARKE